MIRCLFRAGPASPARFHEQSGLVGTGSRSFWFDADYSESLDLGRFREPHVLRDQSGAIRLISDGDERCSELQRVCGP